MDAEEEKDWFIAWLLAPSSRERQRFAVWMIVGLRGLALPVAYAYQALTWDGVTCTVKAIGVLPNGQSSRIIYNAYLPCSEVKPLVPPMRSYIVQLKDWN